jgi:aldose 1-epimerase
MRLLATISLTLLLVGTSSCSNQNASEELSVTQAEFGTTPEGQRVDLYTLKNARGMEVRAISFGGIITSIRVPDRSGKVDDVVLGYDSLEGYLKNPAYMGGIIGRYANRIAAGKFTLEGKTYSLALNNGPNHLHGGPKGFDKVVWKAQSFTTDAKVGVVFSYTSPGGEEGYPGAVDLRVTYSLDAQNALTVDYAATTDAATPLNLTQHSYFNLAGDGTRDVLDHQVAIHASRFTPVSQSLIPTGELALVENTPFDFRTPYAVGARIMVDHPQLRFGNGYDHNFVIDRDGAGLVPAAHVEEPSSGRTLDILTTEPGVQFYTGNFLDGTITGKSGHVYKQRMGFCLETQHFPDSPNQPNFPNTILRPGESYSSQTVFIFGAK